jgi:predicted CoA-binding protein
MKKTIQAFLDGKKIAIVGASNNKDNFGRSLMEELSKKGYQVFPVNPGCEEINGTACVATVRDLPSEVENVILAVPPALTEEIIQQSIGSAVKRVWMIQGVGRGAYSEKAHKVCTENGIEVVHGFCPFMFFGEGMHKFHFWIRKTFGKLPAGYRIS